MVLCDTSFHCNHFQKSGSLNICHVAFRVERLYHVSKQDNTKQKKVQSKEAVKPKLEKVMAKVDEKIKNPLKNLQLKNLLKMDAMVDNQLSLDSYNVAFYAPKDIYLDQLNLIDNRIIYADKSLATYIQNDKMEIKARKLQEIRSRKQQILIELEVLKNG